jgi:signal transduction histidine kinase
MDEVNVPDEPVPVRIMKVQRRLALVLVVGSIVVVALAATSIGTVEMLETVHDRAQQRSDALLELDRLRIAFEREISAGRGWMIADMPGLRERMEEARADLLKALDALRAMQDTPARIREVDAIASAEAEHHQHMLDLKDSERARIAKTFEDELSPRRDVVVSAFDRLDGQERRAVMHAGRDAHRTATRASVVIIGGSVLAFMGMLVMAFLQLRQARKEEAMIERWTDFLSMASHDFKSFLHTLLLRTEVTRHALRKPGVPEAALRSLEPMEAQIRGMEALMMGLLDLTRLQFGALPLDLSEVDLCSVVSDVCRRFLPQYQAADTKLTSDLDAPVLGTWDRLRLDQVASNLISNALKYGNGQPVEVSVEADADWAHLSVVDHGPGIRAEAREQIFRRFVRAKDARGQGHGLGLWITQSIVQALGGRIRLESALGQGSRFIVDLPRRPATTSSRSSFKARTRPEPGTGETLRTAPRL